MSTVTLSAPASLEVLDQSESRDLFSCLDRMIQQALDQKPVLAALLTGRRLWRQREARDVALNIPKQSLTNAERREIRKTLLQVSPYCAYCNEPLTIGNSTLDHITPTNRGGLDIVDNLCLACSRCNSEKSNHTPEEFAKFLQARRDHFQGRMDRLSCLVTAGHFS